MTKNPDGTVTISQEAFDSFMEDSRFLECLENEGVDNWPGYEYAREAFAGQND